MVILLNKTEWVGLTKMLNGRILLRFLTILIFMGLGSCKISAIVCRSSVLYGPNNIYPYVEGSFCKNDVTNLNPIYEFFCKIFDFLPVNCIECKEFQDRPKNALESNSKICDGCFKKLYFIEDEQGLSVVLVGHARDCSFFEKRGEGS